MNENQHHLEEEKMAETLEFDTQYETEGNWYAPRDFLMDFDNVVDVIYIDQTSSGGDWSGIVVVDSGDGFFEIAGSKTACTRIEKHVSS